MDAYEIALLNPTSKVNALSLSLAKGYVRTLGNDEIKGVLNEMAKKIQSERGNKKEYLGGNSIDDKLCMEDAEDLLARALIDRSVYPVSNFSDNKFHLDIEAKAKMLWVNTERQDDYANWMDAQRMYAWEILDEFEQLQQKEMQRRKEAILPCKREGYTARP